MLHGRKPGTIVRYRFVLTSLMHQGAELGLPTDPHQLSEDDCYRLLLSLQVADSSRESYAYILRQFCRYYSNREAESIRILTNHVYTKRRWVDEDELRQALDGAHDPTERILIYLGGCYGLRRAEMATLRDDEIMTVMIVHGKGHGPEGKIRIIPVIPDDPEIARYRDWRDRILRHDEDRTDGRFLIRRWGGRAEKCSPQWVGAHARACFVREGIDGTTHSLRREFVTEAYDRGGKLADIMHIVGHTTLKTTLLYIRENPRRELSVIQTRNAQLYISGEPSIHRESEDRIF